MIQNRFVWKKPRNYYEKYFHFIKKIIRYFKLNCVIKLLTVLTKLKANIATAAEIVVDDDDADETVGMFWMAGLTDCFIGWCWWWWCYSIGGGISWQYLVIAIIVENLNEKKKIKLKSILFEILEFL